MKEFSKDKFIKKDEWFIRGTEFSVKISHVFRKGFPNLGIEDNHAWCLYTMIFNKHPLFKKACKNKVDYDTDLGNKLYPNFHWGCTYYSRQANYVEIGCDYQHLGDEKFMASAELSDEILKDAKELFEYMEEKANENNNNKSNGNA